MLKVPKFLYGNVYIGIYNRNYFYINYPTKSETLLKILNPYTIIINTSRINISIDRSLIKLYVIKSDDHFNYFKPF